MTIKQELQIVVKQMLEKLGFSYHNVVVSSTQFGTRFQLEVWISNHAQSQAIADIFVKQTNFRCTSTSSYKKRICDKVSTIFGNEEEMIRAIQTWGNSRVEIEKC
ncbi:hypothetical protein Aeh1ORF071c [Aeromonas phage Aeh1]|uniref:Uncharacterized protein n=1 Tax=Aeromonas phage Aeh1 TaxID=2880362 RepID=Q76Z15_9CAUD|nr:hypothetical protein Aeh1p076 [Aeromonas phage Aeh1]AAQ17731.1 hypothetical protein Aeh1ORF071c [Aeromonas phage Aeh1]